MAAAPAARPGYCAGTGAGGPEVSSPATTVSPPSTAFARSRSSAPSQRETAKTATQLPRRLVTTRIESMMRSTPSSRATAPAGIAPSEEAVADRARNAEPGMPAMPLLVSISTRTTVIC